MLANPNKSYHRPPIFLWIWLSVLRQIISTILLIILFTQLLDFSPGQYKITRRMSAAFTIVVSLPVERIGSRTNTQMCSLLPAFRPRCPISHSVLSLRFSLAHFTSMRTTRPLSSLNAKTSALFDAPYVTEHRMCRRFNSAATRIFAGKICEDFAVRDHTTLQRRLLYILNGRTNPSTQRMIMPASA